MVEAADGEESTSTSGPDVDKQHVQQSQDADCAALPPSYDEAIVSAAAGEAHNNTI